MTKKPRPSHTKNEWGIPDWRDPGSYGDTRRWSEWEWRWEFMRRREDCRADFVTHKDKGVPGHPLRPEESGFMASFPGCWEKYGLSTLPNPAIGKQPSYVYFIIFRGHARPPMLVFLGKGATEVRGETGSVLKFDLTAPLGDQLEGAKQILERAQTRKLGHLVKPGKKHPAKWLTYLRVLDARESGATLSEIAQSGILNGRKADAQAARDVFEQAQALCFKWPA